MVWQTLLWYNCKKSDPVSDVIIKVRLIEHHFRGLGAISGYHGQLGNHCFMSMFKFIKTF